MISKSHFVEECDSFSVLGQKYHLDPSRTRHSINLVSSLVVSSSMAEIDRGSDCGGINTAAAPRHAAAHMAVSQHRAVPQCHSATCAAAINKTWTVKCVT